MTRHFTVRSCATTTAGAAIAPVRGAARIGQNAIAPVIATPRGGRAGLLADAFAEKFVDCLGDIGKWALWP